MSPLIPTIEWEGEVTNLTAFQSANPLVYKKIHQLTHWVSACLVFQMENLCFLRPHPKSSVVVHLFLQSLHLYLLRLHFFFRWTTTRGCTCATFRATGMLHHNVNMAFPPFQGMFCWIWRTSLLPLLVPLCLTLLLLECSQLLLYTLLSSERVSQFVILNR